MGDSLRPFECDTFHGFVAAQPGMAIVAFRGTVSIGNFLTDAEAALVRHGLFPGLVHYGFCRAVDAVYPAVRSMLSSYPRDWRIWVTGHSLGGAMASLVSHRLASDGFPVRAVYTFGSPRAGDRKFRDAYRLPNYRFVNDNDLVPHLPLRWCYSHVGELKLLTPDGQLLEEESNWKQKHRELVKQAKTVQAAHRFDSDPPLKLTEFDWLADHHMAGYINGIARLLPRVPRRKHTGICGSGNGRCAVCTTSTGPCNRTCRGQKCSNRRRTASRPCKCPRVSLPFRRWRKLGTRRGTLKRPQRRQ